MITTLRYALYGSNPGYPPGRAPASILCTDSNVPSRNDVSGRRTPSFIHPRAPGYDHEDLGCGSSGGTSCRLRDDALA
jgi:hypothetical protein